MSAKLRQGGDAYSVTPGGKLTGAQKMALALATRLLQEIETVQQLERDGAMDLSNILSLLRSARFNLCERFNL